MRSRLAPIALLTLVWAAMWPGLTPRSLLGAVVAGTFVALATTRVPSTAPDARMIRLVPAIRYGLRVSRDLTVASLAVAWETLTPRAQAHPGVLQVPLRVGSHGLITLVANTVTLTPGTVTLDVQEDPPRLYVHVLQLRDAEQTRRRIAGLEHLAISAFGTPSEREAAMQPSAPDGGSGR